MDFYSYPRFKLNKVIFNIIQYFEGNTDSKQEFSNVFTYNKFSS